MPIAKASMLLRIVCSSQGRKSDFSQIFKYSLFFIFYLLILFILFFCYCELFGIDSTLVQEELQRIHATVTSSTPLTSDGSSQEFFIDFKVDPEHFRKIEEFVTTLPTGINGHYNNLFIF